MPLWQEIVMLNFHHGFACRVLAATCGGLAGFAGLILLTQVPAFQAY